MRRIAVLSLLALAVSAVFATSAMAIKSPQKFEASVTSTAGGTKKKPAAVGLHIRPYIPDISADIAANAPFSTDQALVFFPKQLVLNGKYFKTCTRSKVQKDETKCPKGSKIGTGTAAGKVAGAVNVNLTVDVFNGPSGSKVELLVKGVELPIREVIEAKISKVKGTYGWKLTVPIPMGLRQPAEGVIATLTDFDVTIPKQTVKKGKKTYPWAGLTGCSGALKFGYQGKYSDGTNQKVDIEQAC